MFIYIGIYTNIHATQMSIFACILGVKAVNMLCWYSAQALDGLNIQTIQIGNVKYGY